MIPLANHLWQSTLFAAVAGLLALALRRNRAQIRYTLWLTASMKFLIPFSLLVMVGNHFGRRAIAVTPSGIPVVIRQVSQPFAVTVPFASIPPSQPSFQSLIPPLLGVLWAIGFVIVAAAWWRRWRQIRAILRSATPLRLLIGIEAKSSPKFIEPGVFGVWRPILLLPDGITGHLTPRELDAILAHELCHIRRRDNLAAAVHMAVEALFWFHPLVWWLGARLMEERERACDEEVLRMGNEPAVYAEGIIKICEKICEVYAASPLPCAAGVTGGNLRKRIEEIMANCAKPRLSTGKKLLLGAAGMLAVTVLIVVGIAGGQLRAQEPAISWEEAAGGKMAFEVASVKPAKPGTFIMPTFLDYGDAKPPGGRFRANFVLASYISFAYKLDPSQAQPVYAQLPKWANGLYLIEAKAEGNPTKDQMRLMMQSLLADRFKLRVHFETREGPVLALTLVEPGKLGPKLIPHSEGPPCPDSFELPDFSKPPEIPKPGVEWRECGLSAKVRGTSDGTEIGARNKTPGLIAGDVFAYGSLLGELDKPVVDHTGLKGMFDFTLELPAGIISLFPKPPNPDDPPKGTPFGDAVRKQLGLKLERSKGDVRTLIIDHVERPSEN